MEDPRIRKFAKFLINSAVGLEKGEKILIELHGSETGLMKALVEEAYNAGGKPFIHIFDYMLTFWALCFTIREILIFKLKTILRLLGYILKLAFLKLKKGTL